MRWNHKYLTISLVQQTHNVGLDRGGGFAASGTVTFSKKIARFCLRLLLRIMAIPLFSNGKGHVLE